MSKNQSEASQDQAEQAAYVARRDRSLPVLKRILNTNVKGGLEVLASEKPEDQKTGNSTWDFVKAGVTIIAQNPVNVVVAAVTIGYNKVTYGDNFNYYNETTKLAGALLNGQKLDPKDQPFLLRILSDNDEVATKFKKEELFPTLAKDPSIIVSALLKQYDNIDALENEKEDRDQSAQKLAELIKVGSKDTAEITNLEKKIKSFDQKYQRAELIQNLDKIGFHDTCINKNITPILNSGIKYLLKDQDKPNSNELNPDKLLKIVKFLSERNSITDSRAKTVNLFKLLDDINAPKMLAELQLSAFLNKEESMVKAVGVEILKSNSKFKEIHKTLKINDKILEDSLAVGVKIIAEFTKDEAVLAAVYEKLKPVILDNRAEEIAENRENSAMVAGLERQSLIKKLELVGSIAGLIASNATLNALEEIPKLLENNAEEFGQVIENVQANYPNSTASKFIQKTSAGKLEAAEATKLVDSLAKVTKIALPIVTKLAKESLHDQAKIEALAAIIEQTKKVINQEIPDKNQKNYKEVKKQNGQEVKNLIYMFAKFKKNNPEIRYIIDKELPELLQANSKELGAAVDVFLNQTKIGKKLQLDGKAVLLAVGKNTPQLIEIAEAYAQNKYAAIIPKIVPILADKAVLKLLIEAGVNYLTSKNTSANQNKSKVINQAKAIGNNMGEQHINQNSNSIIPPRKKSTVVGK